VSNPFFVRRITDDHHAPAFDRGMAEQVEEICSVAGTRKAGSLLAPMPANTACGIV
jgi:hypothetical protein